jgi:hypothetical protein
MSAAKVMAGTTTPSHFSAGQALPAQKPYLLFPSDLFPGDEERD